MGKEWVKEWAGKGWIKECARGRFIYVSVIYKKTVGNGGVSKSLFCSVN